MRLTSSVSESAGSRSLHRLVSVAVESETIIRILLKFAFPEVVYFGVLVKVAHPVLPSAPHAGVNATGGGIHVLFGAEVEVVEKHTVVGVLDRLAFRAIPNLIEAVVEGVVTSVELSEKLAEKLGVLCVFGVKEASDTADSGKKRDGDGQTLFGAEKEGQHQHGDAADTENHVKLRSVL